MDRVRLYCKKTGIGTGDQVRHKWQGWSGTVRNIVRAFVPERYGTELIDSCWRTGASFPQVTIVADVERSDSSRMDSVPTIELELVTAASLQPPQLLCR